MYKNKSIFSKIRFLSYVVAITILTVVLVSPTVFASLGDYEIPELYQSITDNVKEANDLLAKAFEFAQISPYSVVNSISGTAQGNIAVSIRNASKSMALVVAALLLMVDFFRKSINFEWSSKWENVLIFLIKIIVIKQVVQNTDVIIGHIYSGFQYINDAATGGAINFLPSDNIKHYIISVPYRGEKWYEWGYSLIWHTDVLNEFNISADAVKMFYPNATFPADGSYQSDSLPFATPTTSSNFIPLLENFLLQPQFLILKALAIMIFVIVIGRVFELAVYTILAPLPLVTFASDTTHDVAKNFIKNYIATVLQISVIAVMFVVYVSINKYFGNHDFSIKMIQLVELSALGLGVVKSGAWSKKVCGIG